MQVYQECAVKYSSWLASKPPLELKELVEFNPMCLLDERDNEGRLVFVLKLRKIKVMVLQNNFYNVNLFLGNLDTSKTVEENSAGFDLMIEYGYLQEAALKHGISIIVDMENTSWKYITWLTPNNIRTSVKLITAYPCIDYKIHLVKSSVMFDAAIKILWPILPSVIKENVNLDTFNIFYT